MMSLLLLSSLFITLTLVSTMPAEMYDSQYDNIDIDEILQNDRLYKKYFDCLSNQGKCTPDGKELKDSLPDALTTDCKKCTEKQKKGGEKVLKFVVKNKPDDFLKIESIYDKERVYRKKYKSEIEKNGIKLPE